MATHPDIGNLDEILQRSDALEAAVIGLLEPATYQTCDSSERISASFAACSVSLEHARGVRALIQLGLPTSAIGLMRLQAEILMRSVWLYYAASDADVEKLRVSLTPDAEKAANKLPMFSEMLRAIDGKAPTAATKMLTLFKDVTMGALHSFVHGGIHPLHRQSEGYPMPLLIQVVQNSNALFTMSGMMFANLADNADVAKRMSGIQPAFADCLPELLHVKVG